jgi:hypothetical protein
MRDGEIEHMLYIGETREREIESERDERNMTQKNQ